MYSYSRLQTFQQCQRKYRFRYLDNIRTPREGIEAFVGKRVHETLEKLYRDLRVTHLNSEADLLTFYEEAWEKNWHGAVSVVREGITPGDYFRFGQQCISTYYKLHHPFNQSHTIGLEEKVEIKVREGEIVHSLQGYIDRLAWIPETQTYEIHDYKTGGTVPTQDEADADRQLALYQLAVLQRWPDAKNIKLVWHYLASGREITSTRTAQDLATLEREVVRIIKEIEKESQIGNWNVNVSRLCDWCEYKTICPAFKHETAIQTLPPNIYLQDTGVQLVQKYADLEERKLDLQADVRALENEQKKIEEAVWVYAKEKDLLALDGPGYRMLIRNEDELKVPRKGDDPYAWELLRNTLKNGGKLEDVSTVNGNMLKYAMKKGRWPESLVNSIMGLVTYTTKKTLSLVKKS